MEALMVGRSSRRPGHGLTETGRRGRGREEARKIEDRQRPGRVGYVVWVALSGLSTETARRAPPVPPVPPVPPAAAAAGRQASVLVSRHIELAASEHDRATGCNRRGT